MPSNHLVLCCSLLLLPSVVPRVLSNESLLCIRWPSYWSFSISASNEYTGLISISIGWFNLLASPRNSQQSSPTPQFKSISSSGLSLLYGPTLTSKPDSWKNHSFDYMDLWQQRPLSLFSFFQPVIISTKKKWSSCDMIEVLLLYNGNHITIYSCIKVTCYIP